MSKLFVPLDIETTGLDPHRDYILEMGWVVTDDTLRELTPRRSFIVDQESWGDVFSLLRAEEFVRDMHERSGLLADLHGDELTPLHVIASRLFDDLTWARVLLEDDVESVHLLGRSINFDRSFMLQEEAFRPLFDESRPAHDVFHHKVYDLSSVRLAYELAGVSEPAAGTDPHRALPDAIHALNLARSIRRQMNALMVGGMF